MAQCATTALAGALPWPCVRGARGWFGGLEPVPGVVSPPFPPSRPACPALCVAGRPVWVSLTLARWYAIPRGLCVPRARSGCPSGIPRMSFVCVCARAPAASASPPPLPRLVWPAHLARSRRWALVGLFHAVRAPPRVLPRSCAPFGVLEGGEARSRFLPTWPGVVRSPWAGSARPWRSRAGGWGGVGGGGLCAVPAVCAAGGASGARAALPCSVPLPSLGRQQSKCHWRRSGHGGGGPHTAPVHARLPFPGAVRVAPWRVGAGALVLRGSSGSRRLGWGGRPCSGPPLGRRDPAGGRGDNPLRLGGMRAAAPAACGPVGGGGGGGPAAAPLLSLWGAACGSLPCPPLVAGAFPPPACAFGRGREAVPCTGCGLSGRGGGGGGGAAREPPPRGLRQTQPFPLASPSGQRCGCRWRCSGHGGRGPNTAPVRHCVPPLGVVRASLRRAGAGWPVGRDPSGSRR